MEKENKRLSKVNAPGYDFKTIYKDGREWKGRNPYIRRVELICQIL